MPSAFSGFVRGRLSERARMAQEEADRTEEAIVTESVDRSRRTLDLSREKARAAQEEGISIKGITAAFKTVSSTALAGARAINRVVPGLASAASDIAESALLRTADVLTGDAAGEASRRLAAESQAGKVVGAFAGKYTAITGEKISTDRLEALMARQIDIGVLQLEQQRRVNDLMAGRQIGTIFYGE